MGWARLGWARLGWARLGWARLGWARLDRWMKTREQKFSTDETRKAHNNLVCLYTCLHTCLYTCLCKCTVSSLLPFALHVYTHVYENDDRRVYTHVYKPKKFESQFEAHERLLPIARAFAGKTSDVMMNGNGPAKTNNDQCRWQLKRQQTLMA